MTSTPFDFALTDEQWMQYTRDGYLRLGKLLSEDELTGLQQRIDQIMLGTAEMDYDRMLMQLDTDSGEYADNKPMSKGHKGATLNYRKIEQLETDPTFLRYIQHPLFHEICARSYGAHVPVATFRSMFMNKPSGKGTKLPWHQDRWAALDRDPLITLYTALDPATRENGCVQIIPGTHKYGVINTDHASGFLNEDMAADWCSEDKAQYLEMEPGEVALLHNWMMHSSDKNHSQQSRRAFSVCYMDARTVHADGATFPTVFGDDALSPEQLEAAKAAAA